MKADLKFKLLQHLNQKNQKEKGFTLIELLVVIIIIGILAAIALPSFLNQANKAKQTEAKQTLAAMNKSQQAYYTENNAFMDTMAEFNANSGAGIKTASVNYTYDAAAAGTNVVNLAKPPTSSALLAYAGGVGLVTPAGATDKTSTSVLCQSKATGAVPAAASVSFSGTEVKCPGGDWVDAK